MDTQLQKKLPLFELCIIVLYFVYFIFPAASTTIPLATPILIGIPYTLYVYQINPKTRRIIGSALLLMLVVSVAYLLLVDSSSIAQNVSNRRLKEFFSKFYQMFTMFFPALLFYRILNYASDRQRNILLLIALLLFGIVILMTIRELYLNPNATRKWSEAVENNEKNIGTYAFIYAIPVMIAIVTMALQKFKKTPVKIGCFAALLFLFYFLLISQYTLALLIAAVTLICEIARSITNNYWKFFLYILLCLILLFFPVILQFAIQHVPSEQMAIRLNELYSFFTTGDTDGYNLNGRLTLYKKSLEAFLRSPIIGNRRLDFYGHSTFLVLLADVGLIGGIPFFYLLFMVRRSMQVMLQDVKEYFGPVFLVLVLIGFTNPIESSLPLAIAVWCVAPLALYTIANVKEL